MKKLLGKVKIYGILLGGASIAAFGVSVFLAPGQVVSGGLSGIGIMVHSLTGFPVGAFMLLLNVPLFFIGLRFLGMSFLSRSLFGAFSFSVLTDVLSGIAPVTEDLFLSALFGGALVGIGMGIVFMFGATTGGTDILAQILYKLFPVFDVGKCLLAIDGIIIFISGFVLGNWELCLYGTLAAISCGVLIDTVIQGANFAKVVYVISPKSEQIAKSILQKLDRGVTGLYGKGMFSGTDTTVLLCVVKKQEIPKFEQIVLEEDKNAFIIFTGARSVSGEGFKIYPMN
ncbi:MAG: YitT family protein [Clostridia bacterium]|nr:YitT family protein [Clostridia bacterium]